MVGALLGICQDSSLSKSGYGFMWVHSAPLFRIQVSLLHMPGHRGDGEVCLSLCAECRQCEHLDLTFKSSEASFFRCNFSILQSILNFALEHNALTLCFSRAPKQYFHQNPHYFKLCEHVLFTSSSLFLLLWPQKWVSTSPLTFDKKEQKEKSVSCIFSQYVWVFANPKVQELFYFKHDVISTCSYAQYSLILVVWKVLKSKCI